MGMGTSWLRRKWPCPCSTPPFSCAPPLARLAEPALEQVVRAEGDEAVILLAVVAAQDLLDSPLVVVHPDLVEDRPEPGQARHHRLENACCVGRTSDFTKTRPE
jgi:hypothetical protein